MVKGFPLTIEITYVFIYLYSQKRGKEKKEKFKISFRTSQHMMFLDQCKKACEYGNF